MSRPHFHVAQGSFFIGVKSALQAISSLHPDSESDAAGQLRVYEHGITTWVSKWRSRPVLVAPVVLWSCGEKHGASVRQQADRRLELSHCPQLRASDRIIGSQVTWEPSSAVKVLLWSCVGQILSCRKLCKSAKAVWN